MFQIRAARGPPVGRVDTGVHELVRHDLQHVRTHDEDQVVFLVRSLLRFSQFRPLEVVRRLQAGLVLLHALHILRCHDLPPESHSPGSEVVVI